MTAGIYAARARLKTLLIETYAVPGQAVITDIIENYPGYPEGASGFELIEKFKKQAEKFGLEFAVGEVGKIEKGAEWRVVTEEKTYGALSLIIASGASPQKLNVPGEDTFKGRGVSYCAICDGPLYKGKELVVVGGGDSAVEETLFLTKFASKVTLVHRRDKLRAAKILQEKVLSNSKVGFSWDSVVTEITGKQKVGSVKLENIKTDERKELPCDGVFIFVGHIPNTGFLKDVLTLNEKGFVITDENMKTSAEGVFACGDCRHKALKQIVTACGDGAAAAFSAQRYVEELKGTVY